MGGYTIRCDQHAKEIIEQYAKDNGVSIYNAISDVIKSHCTGTCGQTDRKLEEHPKIGAMGNSIEDDFRIAQDMEFDQIEQGIRFVLNKRSHGKATMKRYGAYHSLNWSEDMASWILGKDCNYFEVKSAWDDFHLLYILATVGAAKGSKYANKIKSKIPFYVQLSPELKSMIRSDYLDKKARDSIMYGKGNTTSRKILGDNPDLGRVLYDR